MSYEVCPSQGRKLQRKKGYRNVIGSNTYKQRGLKLSGRERDGEGGWLELGSCKMKVLSVLVD